MIERLTGIVAAKNADGVVLDVGGVGFLLDVSAFTLGDVPSVGVSATLFTHLHVREDMVQLFGFSTEEERSLFRLLLSVSKIGPRLALAALSCKRPRELRIALAGDDIALLSSVPGIGKKTAERLCMELRDKVAEAGLEEGLDAMPPLGGDGSVALARAALVELGFGRQEAEALLAGLDGDQPVEVLVRQALGRRG